MKNDTTEEKLGKNVPVGSRHYRAFVGPPDKYDLVSAMQFNLLTLLGLREEHSLLDIGCGSLRAGKLFIAYLLPRNYYGVEPERWLVEEGIRNELGCEIITMKEPGFRYESNFDLSAFGKKFDFLLAQSIFTHASAGQIRKCLSEAKKVMKPTSIFACTFIEGKDNYGGDSWVYPGCVAYTRSYFEGLAEEQGLVCKFLNWNHPNYHTWVGIVNKEFDETALGPRGKHIFASRNMRPKTLKEKLRGFIMKCNEG